MAKAKGKRRGTSLVKVDYRQASNVTDVSARAAMIAASGAVTPGGGQGPLDLTGVWFPPGQPLGPVAPNSSFRTWDYPFAINQRIQPRKQPDEGITFEQLRALADNCDLLRLVIETRKDQIAAFEWEIVPAEKPLEASEATLAECKRITEKMKRPSIEPTTGMWDNWLRQLLEDLFVIDAVVVAPRKNLAGEAISLDLVDSATIKRIIDGTGMTPQPPQPAYQQVLHGIVANDFQADELHYWMRNPRSNRLYGFSPVEQIIVTINTILRKAIYSLNYYTEGNIPEAFCGVPETWTMKQVVEFQTYWDSMMEGDLAQRRKMKFVPMDASKMKETKQVDLKDGFDEWLTRIICFAFSISPLSFVAMMNRATADTQQHQATDEGLMPLLTWLRIRFQILIEENLGAKGVVFQWKMKKELDPKTQADVDKVYLDAEVYVAGEVRERLGLKPMTPEQKAELASTREAARAKEEMEFKAKNAGGKPPAKRNGSKPKVKA